MKNQSGIYEILNTVNGKRYIGSAVNLRKRQIEHYGGLRRGDHCNQKLQRAWNKYGEAAFKFLPIITCAKSMLIFYEQQLFDKVKPEYNICLVAGSALGCRHTMQTREKLSKRATGRHPTDDTRKKMSDAGKRRKPPMLGRTHSQESRDRMSEIRTGKKHSLETRLKMGGNTNAKGTKRTPEQRAAKSLCLLGNKNGVGNTNSLGCKHTPEQNAAQSLRMLGKKHTSEQRAARSLRMTGKKRGPYKTKRK